MRYIFLTAFAVALATALFAQSSSSFFSTFDAERGSVVAPARDGNLWLGGQKDERVLLAKLSPEGKVLDKHSVGFEGAGLDLEHLTDLFEESDGTLVGCGDFEGDNLRRGFVFRYNPATRQTLWAHIVRSGSINYLLGITQLGPGGDYVLYGQTLSAGNRDAELLLLDHNTGLIIPGKASRIDLGLSDRFSQLVYHDGALYACGHFTEGFGFDGYGRTRSALCQLDTATLQPVWSYMSPLPATVLANLQGRDLIVDNDALVSTFSGSITDPDLFPSTIFLQKNTLAGHLLWVRQYDLPGWTGEFAEEVIFLPDGYLLYGHDLISDTSRLFLLKTDKDGNAQWARKIVYDYNDELSDFPARSKIIRAGDALFFTALSQNAMGQTQGILLKTDLNSLVADSCAYLQTVAVFPMPIVQPVSAAVVPAVFAGTATQTPATVSVNLPDLNFSKKCGATGTCSDLPDIAFEIESVGCDSAAFVSYRLCNIGATPYSGPLEVGVYESNPLTGAAILLDQFTFQVNDLPSDSCQTGSLKNLIYWGNYSKVFTLAGIESGQITPVDPAGFPYNGIAECDYTNNLDSLFFQYPPPPPFDLGPNTGICPGDTLLLGAGLSGFVSYTWQDGSTDPVFAVTSEGLFSLTVRDGCGRTASDNIVISLKNQPKATREIVLLPGDSVVIDGKTYTASETVISYAPSATGGCDTLVTNKIYLDSLHCERPGSFFKTFKGMSGRVVAPAADGGYYVGGTAQEHVLLKFDATGKNLWVRSFDFFGNNLIQTLIEDSEGMLVGSATSEGGPPTILVFRYNPVTDQMLWVNRHTTLQQNIRGYEVVEKGPGGDFLLVYVRWISTSDFNTHIITFDRLTGEVSKAWRYISRIALSNIEVHQNALYAAGTLSDTTLPTVSWRAGLVKIDLNTGALLWSRLTKTPVTDLYGGSLIVDGDGNIVSTMGQPGKSVWLQKTTPNGDLLWLKKIEVNDPAEDYFNPLGLVRTNDGYAIGIQTFSESIDLHSYIVVKTDKNGDLLWAKKVPKVGGTFTISPHQLASRGNEISFTTNLYQQIFSFTGMVLGKFDKQGNLGESCSIAENSLVSITPQVGNLIPAFVQFTGGIGDFNPLVATPSLPGSTLQNTFCSKCLPPCDSIVVEQILEFYPGDTVFLAGTPYTQPDTVVQTLLTANGCDSVVTTILQLVITTVDLTCPANLTVPLPANQSSINLTYPLPAATTDCPDPDIALTLLQGLPVGSAFPPGNTLVCYEAANQCGARDTCCFMIAIQPEVDETACDVKTPPGSCIKYELLSIRLDSLGRPRYRMRLTNTCASPLRFAYFQTPNGMKAQAPADGAIYTAPGGNTYLVRNPNATPYHSIRFKAVSGSLTNGKSDIFEYALPKQAQPVFILVSAGLEDGSNSRAHINTFGCPVQPYEANQQEPTDEAQYRNKATTAAVIQVRPNPTTGLLLVETPAIPDESVLISVLNARGQMVMEKRYPAGNTPISLQLSEELADGLYYLRVQPAAGAPVTTRFVLVRTAD